MSSLNPLSTEESLPEFSSCKSSLYESQYFLRVFVKQVVHQVSLPTTDLVKLCFIFEGDKPTIQSCTNPYSDSLPQIVWSRFRRQGHNPPPTLFLGENTSVLGECRRKRQSKDTTGTTMSNPNPCSRQFLLLLFHNKHCLVGTGQQYLGDSRWNYLPVQVSGIHTQYTRHNISVVSFVMDLQEPEKIQKAHPSVLYSTSFSTIITNFRTGDPGQTGLRSGTTR